MVVVDVGLTEDSKLAFVPENEILYKYHTYMKLIRYTMSVQTH